MGHTVCFEAGRFTQTQSSATAICCSRKWMSGPADAWAEFVTDRQRQITARFVGPTTALQETLLSAGRFLFSLDKPLSWMSPCFTPLKTPTAKGYSPCSVCKPPQ